MFSVSLGTGQSVESSACQEKVQIGHFEDLPIGQILQHYNKLHVGSLRPGPSQAFVKNEGSVSDLVPVHRGGS